MRRRFWPLLAAALLLSHASFAHAQRYGSATDLPTDFRFTPGVPPPYFGQSPAVVYNCSLGSSFLYLGVNQRYVAYNDYLDRFDRALKFGYPIPRDPTLPPRVAPPGVPVVVDPADP